MKTAETVERTGQRERVPHTKPICVAHDNNDVLETQDHLNYVDLDLLDLKPGKTKNVKVSPVGEENQKPIDKNISNTIGVVHESDVQIVGEEKDKVEKCVEEKLLGSPRRDSSLLLPSLPERTEDSMKTHGDHDVEASAQLTCGTKEVPQNAPKKGFLEGPDKYLQKKTESGDDDDNDDNDDNDDDDDDDGEDDGDGDDDDSVCLVLSGDCVPCVTEDESHYITTHEIQLSELSDHEVDHDMGVGSSSWDTEDDNQVYSFVDYASLDGDEERGTRLKSHQARSNSGAAVSNLLESDLCDTAKCTSSDESLSKRQEHRGDTTGQIHLSIKTTSRAINEPSNIQEKENILDHAKSSGDMSRYVLRGADGKAEKICDRAKCFIAAPGRLHFGTKLKAKEVNGCSSGTSSAVSELDDADQEVRNLTARAFKSLAYPYFDAIHFSTSSDSSASDHGLGVNRWSAYVDVKYGNVNVSQGLDPSLVSHQNPTSFDIAKNTDNKGYKGIALASIKPPPSKVLTMHGTPQSASSSTKKIELMGKFGQGHGGMIRLTETLNFRCNVQSGMSGSERHSKFAQNAAGSRSTYEVTDTLPSGQRRGASKPSCYAGDTMEDTHKKAIFASSLLKNVISKKMQFEQERKMERGEIREPHRHQSPCVSHQDTEMQREKAEKKECREFHRQSSKLSEAGSDLTILCVDELGDLVDTSSCDAKSDCQRRDTSTFAPATNLESANEAGIDPKKGALEACGSTLLPSQNSAFRSWRDGEVEFPKERKSDQTPEGKPPSSHHLSAETDLFSDPDCSQLTKMSQLFVPNIQVLSGDPEGGKPMNYYTRASGDQGEGGGMKMRSGNTLYVADSRSPVTSKSPEIKINLRSVRDNKSHPFGISKVAPNVGCHATHPVRTDDYRCQALAAALKGECSDKVPHFMVRDIRDTKGKLQTPIHQVRDVRKLVKSSYHFVSLDTDSKNSFANADHGSEQKKQGPGRNRTSVSPIVIKCQSVNTNSNGKPAESLTDICKRRVNEEAFEIDRSSPEGAKSGSALLQKAQGRGPTANAKKADASEGPAGFGSEPAASNVQEKTPDITDKKPESKMANQAALEKLQAAVKTMEQLYVFDRNEWKRKDEPQPLTDSHVLSLIASEEQEEDPGSLSTVPPTLSSDKPARRDSYPNVGKTPPALAASPDMMLLREEKDVPKMYPAPNSRDDRLGAKALPMQGGCLTVNKSTFNLSSSQKPSSYTAATNPSTKAPHATNTITQTPYTSKGFVPKSPKLPVSLRISQTRQQAEDKDRAGGVEVERPSQSLFSSSGGDSENYLTIPVRSHVSKAATSAGTGHDKTSVYTFNTAGAKMQAASPPGHAAPRRQEERSQSPRRSSIVMETRSPDTPTATIYHHPLPLGLTSAQPQVYCYSPSLPPAQAIDPFQPTQRKMLLDPTTGNYYLVDTPVQPATRRLFDPETGQYVDVPMPQQTMAPMPVPIAPLALSPGAYGHTYMLYPGLMPTPTVIPARTLVPSQMSVQSEGEGVEKVCPPASEGVYMESPYYVATGKSPQMVAAAPPHLTAGRVLQGYPGATKPPVISITSQQGPRIIAPPSFDGTTMSFVVEHR